MPALRLPKPERPRTPAAARARRPTQPPAANDNDRPVRERLKQVAAWMALAAAGAVALWALV